MNGVFRTVLSMSLSGSLLVLLLLLLRPLLRHRLSQRWWYYVWLIVIARLLLPLTPPASLMGALFSPTEVSPPAVFGEMTPGHTVPAWSGMDSGAIISAEDDTATLNTAPSHIALPKLLRQNIGLAWLMGSLLLLLRRATEYQSFRRFLRAAGRPVDNPALLDRLALLGETMGVRQPVELWESAAVSTPLLLGICRPCIVLPHLNLSEEDFRYTVCHELVHCRRRDVITKWLGQLTLCVHWFNPVLWAAYFLLCRDMEMSCDEAVMRKMDRDIRADYATSLLNLATGRLFPGGTPLAFGEGDTKTRIKNVMRWRRPKPVAAAFSLAVVAMAAVVFGTDPWRADAREAGAGQAAGAENEELRLAADAWAKAFCDRDGNAIASLSTAEYQAYLIEEELLSGVDGDYYGFGWSSPWPWVSGKDYRIVDCTENRTVILYYAWTSVPHVTVWREHLTWEREEGEYRVSAGSLRYLNSISDSGDFAEAYGLGVNGTPIDFLTNGAGEALNENALQNGEYYQALFAPETAARFLLNVSDNEGDAALAAGSRQPDGSVEVAISFPADGGSAVVKMIQPYGEEGIWIVQDL